MQTRFATQTEGAGEIVSYLLEAGQMLRPWHSYA